MTNNKTSSEKAETTLIEFLDDLFGIPTTKTGKTKPFQITQSQKNSLKKIKPSEDSSLNNKYNLVSRAYSIDPTYKNILDLVFASTVCSLSIKKSLLKFAVLVISRNWHPASQQCDNIFQKLNKTNNWSSRDSLSFIFNKIRIKYEKSVSDQNKKSKDRPEQQSNKLSLLLTVAQLKKQHLNVMIIGCLWGAEIKQAEKSAIIELEKLILPSTQKFDDQIINSSARYLLASAYNSPIKKDLAHTIRYYKKQIENGHSQVKKREREHEIFSQKIQQLQNDNHNLKSEINLQTEHITNLEQKILQLKSEAKERRLSEKAERVHLRDDAISAKAKAYNLISEDIEPAMRLSLNALIRPNPKIETAAYQIEVALEIIEEKLPWFDK